MQRQVGWWCTSHDAFASHQGTCTGYERGAHTTCSALAPVYTDEPETIIVQIEYIELLGESHVLSPEQMRKYAHYKDGVNNCVVEWVRAS